MNYYYCLILLALPNLLKAKDCYKFQMVLIDGKETAILPQDEQGSCGKCSMYWIKFSNNTELKVGYCSPAVGTNIPGKEAKVLENPKFYGIPVCNSKEADEPTIVDKNVIPPPSQIIECYCQKDKCNGLEDLNEIVAARRDKIASSPSLAMASFTSVFILFFITFINIINVIC